MRPLPYLLVWFFAFSIGQIAKADGPELMQESERTGRLLGRAVDVNIASIPNAVIRIDGDTEKRQVVTDSFGKYEIELPPGIYGVTTSVPGFCTFRHSAIRLQPSTVAILNLVLEVCPSHGLPFSYESIPLQAESGPGIDLLVRFGERRTEENIIEYRGKSGFDVMASYGTVTIYAQNLKVLEGPFKLIASGSVIVQEGGQRTEATIADVDLSKTAPEINLTQEPTSSLRLRAVRGYGCINGAAITFSFVFEPGKIPGSLLYEDAPRGVKCLVKDIQSPLLLDAVQKQVRLQGNCQIGESLKAVTVTAQDGGITGVGEDSFSINIGESFYSRSGTLSCGDISVFLAK